MQALRWASLPVLVVALTACGVTEPEVTDIEIRTDRQEYLARPDGTVGGVTRYTVDVVLRITNGRDVPVYLGRCYPTSPSPTYGVVGAPDATGFADGSAYSPAWACVGHEDQFRVDPGKTLEFQLQLRAPNARNGLTGEIYGSMDGRKRILLDVSTCPGDRGCPVDESVMLSNVFQIMLPQ